MFEVLYIDSVQEQDSQNGLFSTEQKSLCGWKEKRVGVCGCVGVVTLKLNDCLAASWIILFYWLLVE